MERNREGFTLLETMIALAIAVLVFASILMIESASLVSLEKARRMNVVAMLAQRAMIETEMVIEGKGFKDVDKKKTGKFKPPYDAYTWEREVREVEFPNLMQAASNASGGGAPAEGSGSGDSGGQANTDMSELLGKIMTKYLTDSVREVVVTIGWEKGNGTQSFVLSTYWVDLNHELNVNP